MLLYSAEQSHQIDRDVISTGTDGFALMQKAAAFTVDCMLKQYSDSRRIAIIAGGGNNGGDGLVMAVLLAEQGLMVDVFTVSEPENYQHEAQQAYKLLLSAGLSCQPLKPDTICDYDLLVDAVLGIGQQAPLRQNILDVITWINTSGKPCLAVDMPTGIDANTGSVLGEAVKAECTVTFITRKLGQFIGDGPKFCGDLYYSGLDIGEQFRQKQQGVSLLDFSGLKQLLKPRRVDSHKGNFGHVLVVGGEEGYGGAAILAAVAAIRLGAGKVTLATKACHVMPALNSQPEVMVKSVLNSGQLEPLLEQASVVVVGPGLGQESWGKELLHKVLDSDLPTVFDADALNLIADMHEIPDLSNAILTPHPGEASRLLGLAGGDIQQNRIQAITLLQEKYQATVLLKGAGSLLADDNQTAVCPYGNAHMASGGMGDVLSGMIGAMLAQGLELMPALELAVVLHAKAGDLVAQEVGGLGLVASDLLDYARRLMNDKA